MNGNQTFDQAFKNLQLIIDQVTLELDFKMKGVKLGKCWNQLQDLKDEIRKMQYSQCKDNFKIILPLEDRLKYLEDDFISEVELQLIISDCHNLKDLVVKYEKMTQSQREDNNKKINKLMNQLEVVVEKNQYKMDDLKWKKLLLESNELVQTIKGISQIKFRDYQKAQTIDEVRESSSAINLILLTISMEQQEDEEDEEELLLVVEQLAQLRILQEVVNLNVNEQGDHLEFLEQKGKTITNNNHSALGNYSAANEFVNSRRRNKIKFFFMGLFAAIGAFGGKIGAFFGFGIGTVVGVQVAETLIKKQNTP